MTQIALAEGNRERAREEAERFCDSAAAAGERTWRALAHRTRARVAIASGADGPAEWDLSQAVSCLEEGEASLAAWRVYRLPSRAQPGGWAAPRNAEQEQGRSRAILDGMAETLGENLAPRSRGGSAGGSVVSRSPAAHQVEAQMSSR